ncbi:MAG: hypothetical protein DMF81_09980 [Acidobacteria bacterium]|nr:MAG: hypothetical protein DMF81_09980 [Acidobacteriota bacterium]
MEAVLTVAWDLHIGHWMRTGEFRICPRCRTRNKATEAHCVQCARPLFGIPVARPEPSLSEAAAARAGRSFSNLVIVAGIIGALGVGLAVRQTFRGASLEPPAATEPVAEPSVSASAAPVAATPPPPGGQDFEQGRALLDRGDAQGALRRLAPVAQAEPDSAVVAHAYGRALWGTGSRDRAVTQFERAARIDPGNVAYRIELGRALAALRRTREAIREYEAAVSIDPGNADNVAALASLYSRAGNSAESRVLLERAAMLRPNDPEIMHRLADTADADVRPAVSYTPSGSSAISASSVVSRPPAVPASSALSASSSVPSASSAGVVYTNDDLRRAGGGRTPGSAPPQPPPLVVRPAVNVAPSSAGGDEASWRRKAAERTEALRAAQKTVATLSARVQDLQRQATGQTDEGQNQERQRQLTDALNDLDAAQERLARAQRRLEELQDAAHRKGLDLN